MCQTLYWPTQETPSRRSWFVPIVRRRVVEFLQRASQTVPWAPMWRLIDLPAMPQSAIVTEAEGFEPVFKIERRFEPTNKANFR
jgi:hypothetical protein